MQLLNVTVSPARLQDCPPAVPAMIRANVSLSGCGAVALAHEAKIANAITNFILVLLGTTPTSPSDARGSAQWSRRSRRAAGQLGADVNGRAESLGERHLEHPRSVLEFSTRSHRGRGGIGCEADACSGVRRLPRHCALAHALRGNPGLKLTAADPMTPVVQARRPGPRRNPGIRVAQVRHHRVTDGDVVVATDE